MTDGHSILAVARLLQPHGLRGEIYGISLAPEVLDFRGLMLARPLVPRALPGRSLHPDTPRSLRVESIVPHKTGWLFAFEEIPDRTAAERVRSVELCLRRADLPALPEGCYWEADLEGLSVHDETRGYIGRVEGITESAGRWSLRVVRKGSKAPVFIPWVNALVPRVNLDTRTIETRLPLDYPGIDDITKSDNPSLDR